MLLVLTLKTLFYIIPEKFYEIINIYSKILRNDHGKFPCFNKKQNKLVHEKRFFELPFYILNPFHLSLINYLSNTMCICCFRKIESKKYLKSFNDIKKHYHL